MFCELHDSMMTNAHNTLEKVIMRLFAQSHFNLTNKSVES